MPDIPTVLVGDSGICYFPSERFLLVVIGVVRGSTAAVGITAVGITAVGITAVGITATRRWISLLMLRHHCPIVSEPTADISESNWNRHDNWH